ncbi:DEAD/DEAH box helicase [Pseudobacteriovorax antillogorgiicola]|uniref:DNA 3'-5' helicase n=1 Tax=Pseudobacteriovorax antillogorgiicola TaxID=1513793 RepID=A0A1Y6B5E1_9BACT|nr:DEAD/DEAH box helicase family protein [Pseudobacteriovorax antillogorgiicola]TCS59403.1 superfamily II DNA or RNA helicase [Pseudobacteriovorax antillogorgiicola]SME88626.1 Superfamily II DNA or RNA helicase [Pseudobacteriovorax antillogorgiicola]
MTQNPKIEYDDGTLVIGNLPEELRNEVEHIVFDQRTKQWRSPAYQYRDIVYQAFQKKIPLEDRARAYDKLDLSLQQRIIPRDHQKKALESWESHGGKGVVCLPTGAGKTILAVLAMAKIKRPTLVVVPTIDLLHQWQKTLSVFFSVPIGSLGGGDRDIQTITVSTYDSAYLMIDQLSCQFGFVVFDECHHLPSPQYQMIARSAIAPFRLGLSATVERPDGKEEIIYELLGDLVYEGMISSMVADVLSPYDVVSIEIDMTDEEREEYKKHRKVYTDFLRRAGVNFSSPGGWQEFIRKSARMPGGQEAMDSYRKQKQLSQGSEGKVDELWNLFQYHRGDRIIVFTNDNALAYRIGEEYILPVLTHQTKPKERKRMLSSFRSGELDILVTSKVLNEGVDVPEASVGIVVSGSGAVREHVQRLGRILRHQEGKRAVLYELISKDTSEKYVNQRRRMHHAYQSSSEVHKP